MSETETDVAGLVERLLAKREGGRTLGGGVISSDGYASTWGNEPIMVPINPDGQLAAALITRLQSDLAAANARAAYQARVGDWLVRTFDQATVENKTERVMRFLEEAMELGQALGITAAQTAKIAEYVYGRPVGEAHQEVGGVMVTLAALCHVFGLDMQAEGEREYVRIDTPEMRAKIAAKQVSKRMFGMTHDTLATPTETADERQAAIVAWLRERAARTKVRRMRWILLWLAREIELGAHWKDEQ